MPHYFIVLRNCYLSEDSSIGNPSFILFADDVKLSNNTNMCIFYNKGDVIGICDCENIVELKYYDDTGKYVKNII